MTARTFPAIAMAFLALTLAGWGGPARAQADRTSIQVHGAFARATIGASKTGAAYMRIENTGAEPDRLVGAKTDEARKAELHTTVKDGDVMKMRPLESVEIAPGEAVAFEPRGRHVMLMGLKAPLKEGERFGLTLTFERAGDVPVTVQVRSIAAMGPGRDKH